MRRAVRSCAALATLLCALSACDRPAPSEEAAASSSGSASSGAVDGAQAKRLVSEGAKLVDVRTPAEYAGGHVDGAENVPVDAIREHDLGPKDAPIVLYCQSGRRSARAAAALRERGYTRVYDLGPMSSWDG